MTLIKTLKTSKHSCIIVEGISDLSGVSFMESYKHRHEVQSYPHDL